MLKMLRLPRLCRRLALSAGKIRAVKSRETQLRLEGMTGTRAGQAAVASVSYGQEEEAESQQEQGRGQVCSLPVSSSSTLNEGKELRQT